MRLLPLLSLISGLLLAVSSASAVTVLSVTGTPAQCNATGGNAGNMATGVVAAKSWTQTQGYANVSISAAIDDLNTFPVPFPNFTVYLTTSAGPGTTTAQEIAHASVMAPLVSPWTTNLTALFTGLTLPPGTYYLTIYGDPNGPALGPSCWTYSNSPVITSDSGVSNIRDLQVLGVAAYPPASSFHQVAGTFQLLQVTGNAIAPPSITKAFGSPTIPLGGGTGLTFSIVNPNPTVALTGVAFTDTFPTGLTAATVSGFGFSNLTCGIPPGTFNLTDTSFSVSGLTIPGGATCTLTLLGVTGTIAGVFTNTTGAVTSTNGGTGNSASATITVIASYLERYAANLNLGESYIDITNTGANGAPLLGPGFGGTSGNLCVDVYAFDAGEELISCCSCLITPDQTVNLGVVRDLTVKTLTGIVPTSVTVKLLSTLAGGDGTGTSCTNSAATATTATIATNGLAAWGTTLHSNPTGGYDTTETAFTPSTLSPADLASISGRCAAILGNGSGFGVCNSCRAGALGGTKLPE